ncbi:MAG TPA: pyrimidine reductase family protein [Mycobacteriales bacterium]
MTTLRELFPVAARHVDPAEAYAFPDGTDRCVRAVFVSSLDGAATKGGRSGGLGGATDRTVFAVLRGLADVILVGAGTARAEGYGPVTAASSWDGLRDGRSPTPPIALVSRSLDVDLTGPLFADAPEHARTIVLTCAAAPAHRRRAAGRVADVIVAGDDQVEISVALAGLAQRGHRRISCEGGPRLFAQVARDGCLDELCLTLSPLLLAGDAPRITNGPALSDGLDLDLVSLFEDQGYLFLRYGRRPASTP